MENNNNFRTFVFKLCTVLMFVSSFCNAHSVVTRYSTMLSPPDTLCFIFIPFIFCILAADCFLFKKEKKLDIIGANILFVFLTIILSAFFVLGIAADDSSSFPIPFISMPPYHGMNTDMLRYFFIKNSIFFTVILISKYAAIRKKGTSIELKKSLGFTASIFILFSSSFIFTRSIANGWAGSYSHLLCSDQRKFLIYGIQYYTKAHHGQIPYVKSTHELYDAIKPFVPESQNDRGYFCRLEKLQQYNPRPLLFNTAISGLNIDIAKYIDPIILCTASHKRESGQLSESMSFLSTIWYDTDMHYLFSQYTAPDKVQPDSFTKEVETALTSNVNMQDTYGNTPLIYACEYNNLKFVKKLIAAKADINLPDHYGNTPLITAALYNRPGIVQFLIEHGADIESKNLEGKTAFFIACEHDNIRIVEYMFRNKAGFNIITYWNKTLKDSLNIAIQPKTCGFLEKENVLSSNRSSHSDNAFFASSHHFSLRKKHAKDSILVQFAELNDLPEVKTLISSGTDVNEQDKYGNTALHKAILKCNMEMIQYLIKAGADIYRENNFMESPLKLTCRQESEQIMEFILENCSVRNSVIDSIATAFAGSKGAAVLKKLDKMDVGLDTIQGMWGDSLLHVACTAQNIEAVEFLLSIQFDVNNYDYNFYRTPLMIAAANGDQNIINLLINRKATIDFEDKNGDTALYYAIAQGNTEAADILIRAGTDINHLNKNKQHPIDYSHSEAMARFMLDKNDAVSPQTLLTFAETGMTDALKKYMPQFKNEALTLSDKKGNTLLMIACDFNHYSAAQFLIESGADVNAQNKSGHTAIHFAKSAEIVDLLLKNGAKEDNYCIIPLARAGKLDKIKQYIENKTPDFPDDFFQQALNAACYYKQSAVVDLFLDNSMGFHSSVSDRSYLEKCSDGDLESVKLYVKANVQRPFSPFGNTVLICACKSKNKELVSYLLSQKASANRKNTDHETPLIIAAQNNLVDIARLLLEHNADATITNNNCYTPLEIAQNKGYTELTTILKEYAVKKDSK